MTVRDVGTVVLIFSLCPSGTEEVTRKENAGRIRTASTTIAEEAVDQLQASEKLIAGKKTIAQRGCRQHYG